MHADSVLDRSTGRVSQCVTRSHGHTTFTAEYNANQINIPIITPPGGRRISVCGIYWATASNAGMMSLDFSTSGIIVLHGYATRFQHANVNGIHIEGAMDEPLSLSTWTGGVAFFILVNYRIID